MKARPTARPRAPPHVTTRRDPDGHERCAALPCCRPPLPRHGPPIPLASEADLYCCGYIGATDEPMPNYIASFEDADTKYMSTAKEQGTGVATNDDHLHQRRHRHRGRRRRDVHRRYPERAGERSHTAGVIGRHYDYRRTGPNSLRRQPGRYRSGDTGLHGYPYRRPAEADAAASNPAGAVPALPSVCEPGTGARQD